MLAVLLSGWFLTQFDFFVVNVAADTFRRGLGAGPAELELIVGGYAFSYAAGMITGGRLGDRFGHRRVFVAGVLAFTAASLLCGVAQVPFALVVARLLQGLAGALMVPQVLALITAVFPPHARGRALGWYGAVGGLGSIAGQVLGGLLLDADVLGLGWRVIFLVNVPVGGVAAVLAARLLPEPGTARGRADGQDPVGAVGLAAGLALLLLPLVLGREQGWPAWTWISMVTGAVLVGLVARWQRRLAAHGGAPVLDVTLFRSRSYLAGIGAVIAFMLFFASFMFTLSLLLQGGLGLGALQAGLVFAPMGVLFSVTALLGPRLVERYGPLVTVYGCGIVALGLLLLALRLDVAGGRVGTGWIVVALALVGLGDGLVLPRLIGIALTDVRPGRAGVGAAVLSTAQQFAGAAGVAVLGTVYFAAAGPGGDAVRGMQRTVPLDIVLIAVVALLVARLTGTARRRRRPSDDRNP